MKKPTRPTIAFLICAVVAACTPVKSALVYPTEHCQYGSIYNCAHYPATPLLTKVDSAGYRFQNTPTSPTNSDDLFVVMTLSGGGTRAAAFSYGVMRELQRTMVPKADRTMLDEVDLISSVSGGSFPAAYLGLYGAKGLSNFESDFLNWDAQGSLIKSVFLNEQNRNRMQSRYFSRSDIAVEHWDQRLFHGATFAQLIGHRPYLMINGTDLSQGTVFPFTQSMVDPLCIDLSKFTIARAVGASSAFPPLLNPLTIENHGTKCDYSVPAWAIKAMDRDDYVEPQLYQYAAEVRSYTNTGTRPYIQLSDGGVSDNIGARNIIRALSTRVAEVPMLEMIDDRKIKRVLIIIVNSKTTDPDIVDTQPYAPTLIQTFLGAISSPLNNYSSVSIGQLFNQVRAVELQDPKSRCSNGEVHDCLSMFYTVEISFDEIKAPTEQNFFQNLPTSFYLPPKTIDALTFRGGDLLRSNKEYNRLLCDIQHTGINVRDASEECKREAYKGVRFAEH